ncbi:MAG: cobalamin-binding protein [Gammaproteobacteria bacterium]
MNIVSLLPSATEIICALGLRDQLVAVSHECDYPAEVKNLPKATTTVIDSGLASAAIDKAVREHLAENSALYSLDVPVLEALEPDLLVTQALCDVCAVSAEEVDRVACALPGKPDVLNLEPMSLEEVFDCIRDIGTATRSTEQARAVRDDMRRRIDTVASLVRQQGRKPRRVAFLEWLDPLFNGGHWTPELIEIAGGIDVFGGARKASHTFDWSQLMAAEPEVLFIACCGFSTERALADLPTLTRQPGWTELPCVKTGQVFVADGNQFFNRPGPRLADSLEVLADALNPGIGLPDPGIHRAIRCELTGSQTQLEQQNFG